MAVRDFLGEFELMVLLAVIRTGDGAYGVPILKELCDTTRRDVILLAERLGGGSGWTCLLAPTAINGVLKRSVG